MGTTPAYSAARAGLLGDTGAVDHAAQVDQFLGAHPSTEIYAGTAVLTPDGIGGTGWTYHLDAYDIDQPFTMSGTKIGRVVVPLLPVGGGADIIVGLYTDSGGNPGTLVQQTRIPAAWINKLAAVSGVSAPSTQSPITQYTNSPIATAQFNGFNAGFFSNFTFNAPAAGANVAPSSTYLGNYSLWAGGLNTVPTAIANVYTVSMDGAGNVGSPVPQQSLPVAISSGAVAIATESGGTTTAVFTGGWPAALGTSLTTVYAADFNTSTGNITSWSSQTALPTGLAAHAIATWNGFVYVSGGMTSYSGSGTTATNLVYWAQVQNGQISAWNAGPVLPESVFGHLMVASNGFLFVTGGQPPGAGAGLTNTYYAPINADGSLGVWQTGPALPYQLYFGANPAPGLAAGTVGIVIVGGGSGHPAMLGVGPNGPATVWQQTAGSSGASSALVQASPGIWQYYGFNSNLNGTVVLAPQISVPLPATGLTNGATYHIVLSQPGGDPADYLYVMNDNSSFPGAPTAQFRTKGTSTWTPAAFTSDCVPIAIYDQTASGKVWHTWADSGARVSTLVWGTTPDAPLVGALEATAQPGPVLNSNFAFTTGTAPWTATGGTLAQSSAHVQGGLPFSALLTPSGSAASSFIECEQVAVRQGHSCVATMWLYSPPGYSSVAVNINWYKADHTALSTTSGTVTALTAATWTQLSTTGTVPANAAYGTAVAIETGTPANTKTLYVSAATIQDTSGPMLASVAEVSYPGTWPSTAWPPTSVTQFA